MDISVLKPARQLSGTAASSIREMMDVLSLVEIKKDFISTSDYSPFLKQ
jgi:hypothetical protein